ncbi:putative Transposon, transposition helper protein C [Serratia proteamaculans]|uniref:TniB family NTP-binding protein n=1 Tax=Serratia proteamaculans TaxID=28151 RepID=UPI0009F7F6DB|nr:TniB family NTP-binding protein [Serratia proteamaculans]SMB54609.1 putative Transposon, transposition helper protein C [Serratia proteamaculans]HBV28686.1 transposase [Shigella sp.]HEJ7998961.1 TniB family NTP-binding protein [Serratia liquefaciens]
MTGMAHIHKEFRHIAELSARERIDFIEEPRWIGYARAHFILDTLQELMRKPRRPRMTNLLLVGDPNNGKTTIARRFYQSNPPLLSEDMTETTNPLVLAEAPPTADEKGLYISILERLYTPYRASDATTKLRYQVIHLLRACKVRMLMIDEFHSLLTGTALKQREVMNAIKLLCNELEIPIVGIGTREAVRVLHTDPQHASRFDVITLPSWQLNTDFQHLLAGFESVMPLRGASRLHEPELAMLLHAICGGNIGDLHRLLMECCKEAITTGQEHIDKSIIESKSWCRPTKGIREIIL